MGTSQNAALAGGVSTPPPISPHRYQLRLSIFSKRLFLTSMHTPIILCTISQQAFCLTKLALGNLITPQVQPPSHFPRQQHNNSDPWSLDTRPAAANRTKSLDAVVDQKPTSNSTQSIAPQACAGTLTVGFGRPFSFGNAFASLPNKNTGSPGLPQSS